MSSVQPKPLNPILDAEYRTVYPTVASRLVTGDGEGEEMCKELEDELNAGRKAAEAFVAHVQRMGAAAVTIPAEGDECSVWIVTAKLVAR